VNIAMEELSDGSNTSGRTEELHKKDFVRVKYESCWKQKEKKHKQKAQGIGFALGLQSQGKFLLSWDSSRQ
jgi:hypothetical protein